MVRILIVPPAPKVRDYYMIGIILDAEPAACQAYWNYETGEWRIWTGMKYEAC